MLALQEFPHKILTRGIGRVNIGELLTRTKYNLQSGALRGNPLALEAPSPTRSGFPRNLRVTRHCGERSDATIQSRLGRDPMIAKPRLIPACDGTTVLQGSCPASQLRRVSRFAGFPGMGKGRLGTKKRERVSGYCAKPLCASDILMVQKCYIVNNGSVNLRPRRDRGLPCSVRWNLSEIA